MFPRHCIGLFLLLIASVPSYARSKQLSGRVLAYDPAAHTFKMASFVENQEIVILQFESANPHEAFVKLVVHGFQQNQISAKYITGADILTVTAVRDHTCDQKSVELVSTLEGSQHAASEQGGITEIQLNSGKFLISRSFSGQSFEISNLKCYSLRAEKEQQ